MPRTTQVTGVKLCKRCSTTKPIDNFYIRKRGRDLRHSICKECTKKIVTEKYRENPMVWREAELKRRYDMNQDDYNQILTEQNNCCAICGTTKPGARRKHFMIDHCHTTGKVRGLLCKSCNIAIGEFKDDVSLLEKAVLYLRK